jgi:peptide deformylase
MPKLLAWNLSRLKTKSRPLTGPLPELYVRELTRMVEELNGVYLSGIQVGDPRRFAIPNPRFKDFPILYNPEIIAQDDPIRGEGEGCLSFPGLWVPVSRYTYVTVRYRDGQWQERTAVFGNEDPNTEEALLAKAVQHEVAHMDGIVLHDRIADPQKRIKIYAQILRESLAQNRSRGIPQLLEGPSEMDPLTVSIVAVSPEPVLGDQEQASVGNDETVHEPNVNGDQPSEVENTASEASNS